MVPSHIKTPTRQREQVHIQPKFQHILSFSHFENRMNSVLVMQQADRSTYLRKSDNGTTLQGYCTRYLQNLFTVYDVLYITSESLSEGIPTLKCGKM